MMSERYKELIKKVTIMAMVMVVAIATSFIPAPLFASRVPTEYIRSDWHADDTDRLAQTIREQAKESIRVTVGNDSYYILVLKNRIDPSNLQPQAGQDQTAETKVYTDLEYMPIADAGLVNKIQYIDAARRWSDGRASAQSIKQDLQIIDDFARATAEIRAEQNALDLIAWTGGTVLRLLAMDGLNTSTLLNELRKEVPDQLKSIKINPKNWAAIFGYCAMQQSKGYLNNALAWCQQGEITDYYVAKEFMNNYLTGWSEFSAAYSLVFESFIQGNSLEDTLDFALKLAKNILPTFLRKEFFEDTEMAEDILDLVPIIRYNQLKSESSKIQGEFNQAGSIHARYTLELAKAGTDKGNTPGKSQATSPASFLSNLPQISFFPSDGWRLLANNKIPEKAADVALYDGILYVNGPKANWKGYLAAFEIKTGRSLWSRETEYYLGKMVANSKALYVMRPDMMNVPYQLWCFNKKNGETLWSREYAFHDNVLSVGEFVYACGRYVRTFYAMDEDTGTIQWRVNNFHATSAVVSDGVVIAAAGNSFSPCVLAAFKEGNGDILWKTEMGQSLAPDVLVAGNGVVVARPGLGSCWVFDLNSGKKLWESDSHWGGSEITLAGDRLVSATSHNLEVYRARTGELVFKLEYKDMPGGKDFETKMLSSSDGNVIAVYRSYFNADYSYSQNLLIFDIK